MRLPVRFVFLLISISASFGCSFNERFQSPRTETCEALATPDEFIVVRESGDVELSPQPPDGDYLFYEPNYRLLRQPQPGLVRLQSQTRGNDWYLLGVDIYWDAQFFGQNRIVAVVDSAIDMEVESLQGQLLKPESARFAPAQLSPSDVFSHSVAISHLIAGNGQSQAGRGLAPKAKILPVDFLGSGREASEYEAINAVEFALNSGAHVINNSWSTHCSLALQNKYQDWKHRNALFVHSAGNQGMNLDGFPYSSSNIHADNFIVVGSLNNDNERASFSSYGEAVDIYTWGEDLLVPATSVSPLSMLRVDGTSFSAAIVSGAAALVWSAHPEWTAAEVKDFLVSSASQDALPVLRLPPLESTATGL